MGGRVQISFPQHAASLLESLNLLRLEGKFCDVHVHVGGRVFPAHKSVLAAASPFFHDKLLLQDGARLLLPPAIDPDAFEGLLHLIYSGRLSLVLDALPGHLLVASGLQMWHVVDQCSEILREMEGGRGCRWGAAAAASASSASGGRGGEAAALCGTHGGDGASASSWTNRGGDGASCLTHGGDGASCMTHGGDGASASSWTNRGGDGASCMTHGGDGSSCLTHGGDGALCISHGGDGASASSWTNRAGDGASCVVRGRDGASASSWTTHGGDGSSRVTRDGDGASSWTSRAGDGPSSPPWPKEAGEEVLKICVQEEEEEEEEEEEDEDGAHRAADALQIVLEEEEEEEEEDGAPRDTHDPPKVFYIKQEAGEATEPASVLSRILPPGSGTTNTALVTTTTTTTTTATATAATAAAAASIFNQASWKPVDLHGNEILGRAPALHAPVKLGAAPDGKRFGCLCGKRFAVKPKRDRHIMLTFSLRPFSCGACHKRFKLKHHLTEHMKTHDGAGRACERCGTRFRLRSGLDKHRPLCQGPRWAAGCWACE
ncbi:zinc finger and BTB domain-containing protein 9 [Pezoporus wallicus]|uniref:zinc finger and BTB domain-containing protein 9 n=1 Tax=Pezoporus wallicus TaxID=35540 RepID=UPI00254EC0E3|nr:zinc finger and BTB domain-containing protein 9 [Pezoporus wallicus]